MSWHPACAPTVFNPIERWQLPEYELFERLALAMAARKIGHRGPDGLADPDAPRGHHDQREAAEVPAAAG